MTLVLKPRGRGNWSTVLVTITGARSGPLLFRRGDPFVLAGTVFRIAEVRA